MWVNYFQLITKLQRFRFTIMNGRKSEVFLVSFLIATRIDSDLTETNFKEEDASIILLRVTDAAQLPNSSEAKELELSLLKESVEKLINIGMLME